MVRVRRTFRNRHAVEPERRAGRGQAVDDLLPVLRLGRAPRRDKHRARVAGDDAYAARREIVHHGRRDELADRRPDLLHHVERRLIVARIGRVRIAADVAQREWKHFAARIVERDAAALELRRIRGIEDQLERVRGQRAAERLLHLRDIQPEPERALHVRHAVLVAGIDFGGARDDRRIEVREVRQPRFIELPVEARLNLPCEKIV
ncbi:hypothetical protein Y023_5103 [Burkholderia pseudomallei A79D]|nr:hypothetical protein Y023_5103 [Burkholderia pseudomallei A79D]KGX97331.1 hypothetical protein X997_4786 [Burkholderia pseudomallei A79C]